MNFDERINAIISNRIDKAVEQALSNLEAPNTPEASPRQTSFTDDESKKPARLATNGEAAVAVFIHEMTGADEKAISQALQLIGISMSAAAIRQHYTDGTAPPSRPEIVAAIQDFTTALRSAYPMDQTRIHSK